ncbi:MAG: metal-sulfur cluster assembly factor [Hyphomicrobiales bacterium]|nr:metal-sulfur cluster assembly factor [Hyphomicrobiales bacterium]
MDKSVDARSDADPLTVERIRAALVDVVDPEVGINVVDLGLIYDIAATAGRIRIEMTMTTPSCPMGTMLVDEVARAAQGAVAAGGADAPVDVDLVWEPAWHPGLIAEDVRRRLGWKS